MRATSLRPLTSSTAARFGVGHRQWQLLDCQPAHSTSACRAAEGGRSSTGARLLLSRQQAPAVCTNSAVAVMANQLHSVLRVSQSGSIVQLQPFRGQDVDGDTLSIDLTTGSIRLRKQVMWLHRVTAAQQCRILTITGTLITAAWPEHDVSCRLWAHAGLVLLLQAKIDRKFDIAFGVAGLAQLASGYALVLILAGENVSRDIRTNTLPDLCAATNWSFPTSTL